MKAVTAERDRHASDKIELIAKASLLSKELDGASAQLAASAAERDGLRAELSSTRAERDRLASESARASEEIERLKGRLAAIASPDPAVVLADWASEKTKALVAWTRAKIPADSPALPWFDRAVSGVTTAGCVGVKLTRDIVRWLTPRIKDGYAWAKPRALELYAKAKTEIEAKLDKKG